MRTWRVGSFSMGAALLLLGVFLLLGQVFKWGDPAVALLSWWPIIFIILGIEIIIYMVKNKQENKHIKYDIISIIFIGIIGTCGLGMAMLSASGLLELAGDVVKAEVRTASLPTFEETDMNGINRVVVDAGPFLNIETTTDKGVSLFGTYQEETVTGKQSIEKAADYVQAEKKGDTLYLKVKELPYQRFTGVRSEPEATLIIPSEVKLEVKGGSSLSLKPRNLKQSWSIDSSGFVQLKMDENENIRVNANEVNEIIGEGWKNLKEEEESGLLSGNLIFGKGTNSISIYRASTVEVH